MASEQHTERVEQIATELLAQLGSGKQIEPFSKRFAGFDLGQAYAVAERVRELRENRGERAVGRKIGFTNRAVQAAFGISAPMWNYMFNTTVRDLGSASVFNLAGTSAPRIEPEIVLHLSSTPHVGMTEADLASCIDWVAHGFEIVDSIFPNWSFTAPDAAAGFGVHKALLLGPRQSIADDRARWLQTLATFGATLTGSDGTTRSGSGANVLGSPISALRVLIEDIARYPHARPLDAGEIITTGTLTDAMPVAAGQRWSTRLEGIALDGIAVEFR